MKITLVTFMAVYLFAVARGLRCNSGFVTTMNDRHLSGSVYEQDCPPETNTACLTVTAEMAMGESVNAQVYLGSCSSGCSSDEGGCDELLRSMQDNDGAGDAAGFNVTNCNVNCCNSSDLCNPKFGLNVSIPESGPDQRKCYTGLRQTSPTRGVLFDDTKAITCPVSEQFGSDTSCLLASLVISDGSEANTGSMILTQCQPTVVCERFTCDIVMQFVPESIRGMVKSCDMSCCNGDLCNSSPALQRPLTVVFTAIFVWFSLAGL
uniref:UPAR/Ly6 domain-containing protein n=1 Tax=Ciona savignyi TaxID=51511 RepID=H2Z190_CIOSA